MHSNKSYKTKWTIIKVNNLNKTFPGNKLKIKNMKKIKKSNLLIANKNQRLVRNFKKMLLFKI
jgi:hypothetical protein